MANSDVRAESDAESEPRARAAVAMLLASVGGCVDALAYLSLGDALVAHMSGNTVHAMVSAASGAWSAMLFRLTPIAGFVGGAIVGRVLADVAREHRARHRMATILLTESAVLACALLVHTGQPITAMMLAASAMGIQNAALRHVAGHNLRTTFITGMLVALADEWVASFLQHRRDRRGFVWLHAGVWFAFSAGALAGALTFTTGNALALVLPALALATTIAWDLIAPLSVEA